MKDDHKLKQDVLDELAWEPSISADHIGVTAKDGVVTLMGHVDTYWQKRAAELAVGRVQGVKAIAEEIEIKLPFTLKRSDEEIASAAIARLAWDITLPKDSVMIKVEDGFVTLTGQVDWQYQKLSAAEAIRSLSGVTGIANHCKTKPRPDIKSIGDDIMNALHRSWYFDDNIKVSADGGKVHLTGNVDTWNERQTAASTAWASAGTTSVINDIHIN